MNKSRGWFSGFLTAGASLLMVLGAVFLSQAEGRVPIPPTPIIYPTLPVYDYSFPETATQVIEIVVQTATPPISTSCTPPAGWQIYRVQPGDSLTGLSVAYNIASQQIVKANCLVGESLPPSSLIFLPPLVPSQTLTPTRTQTVCGPPPGWVAYRIQPEDNLFRLSLALGISIPELQFANCMGNSTVILAGNYLMVPFIPVRTATATPTPTGSFTPTWTATSTFPSPTIATPTETYTPTSTPTNSTTSTSLPEITPTWTPPPTISPTETVTSSHSG